MVSVAQIERELKQAGRRHKTATERATTQRDEAIRRAAQAGMSRRQIAKHVGISFQRVQQIVSNSSR